MRHRNVHYYYYEDISNTSPPLHALAALSARKSLPRHPNRQSPPLREGPVASLARRAGLSLSQLHAERQTQLGQSRQVRQTAATP